MPHIKNALIRYRIIDRCLRNKYKPFPTKKDLRAACEEALFGSVYGDNICDSTIEKDMFAMKMEHDAPIKYSKLNGGYFYEDPNFSINDIPLTDDDLSAIKFALSTLMQFREVEMFRQFGSAMDKIVDRVAISSSSDGEDVGKYVQFETAISLGGNEFLTPLLDAIRNKFNVNFKYGSFISGNAKQRSCLPLLLKEYRNRWYLISFDNNKEDVITYALDRMSDLIITKDVNTKAISFDADGYFKYVIGISVDNTSKPQEVILKVNTIAAKYLQSQPLHFSQKLIKEEKEASTLSLEVMISEELIRLLLSFAGELEIIKPQSLRKIILERVSKMQSSHKN
jgi:predicted DNA-binding transcriptional regulator YafY